MLYKLNRVYHVIFIHITTFVRSLEQLASYNGADMYKYNMIYTFKINQNVLTPES